MIIQERLLKIIRDDNYAAGFQSLGQYRTALLQAARGEVEDAPVEQWLPMDTAPKDGTLVRLLVQFDDHATEDQEEPSPTIGHNSFDNTDEDQWQFAGWNWCLDCYTEGKGTPLGWLPMLAPAPAMQGEPVAWQRADRPERIVTVLSRRTWKEVVDGVEFRALYTAPQPAPDVAGLVEALEKYESAFEELFVQCCSNPITNAWGKPVSMAALNDAHAFASSRLAAHGKQGGDQCTTNA